MLSLLVRGLGLSYSPLSSVFPLVPSSFIFPLPDPFWIPAGDDCGFIVPALPPIARPLRTDEPRLVHPLELHTPPHSPTARPLNSVRPPVRPRARTKTREEPRTAKPCASRSNRDWLCVFNSARGAHRVHRVPCAA
ncbi:hypothetical protein GY45DRAFT_18165 [Cubamyces sp. BRFM 1775]|nr:hypothetical protein GY45DRAFT_18165 [Cubamyces sp. BRFM 1775]